MKRLLPILVWLFFSFPALWAEEERIYTYHSDIAIETDGQIRVREEIRIYAGGQIFKRGITRALPLSRRDANGKSIRVDYQIERVLQNGVPAKFFTEKSGGDLVIYVGDKKVFLDPGFYDYEIFYSVAGQIAFFEDYDELYWNVNAASDFVTDRVSSRITLPASAEILNHHCYTGRQGSTQSNCRSETEDGVLYTETEHLEADGLLTVAVAFTPGVVQAPALTEAGNTIFQRLGLVFVSLILMIIFPVYYIRTWRKHGVDPPKPTVIPRFAPPAGMSPASVGMLHKSKYTDDLVTASIVNLAVKGYLKIEEGKVEKLLGFTLSRNYNLIKQKEADESLPSEERDLMRNLFTGTDKVELSGKYDSGLESMMETYREGLSAQHSPLLNEGRNLKFHIVPLLLIAMYIFILIYFAVHVPGENILSYGFLSLFTLPSLFFLLFLLTRFIKKLRQWFLGLMLSAFVLMISVSAFIEAPISELSPNSVAFLIAFPVFVISYMIYAYLIIRPAEKKLDLQARIEGLKMYMDVAEEKQLQHFNPPEVTPEVFEKLLPYALALGMDKVWGEKFQKQFLASLQDQNSYRPVWYSGRSMSPARFGNTLGNSLFTSLKTSASNPESGRKCSSGSSGGGFSGGGGGGGRAGGW